MADYGPGYDPIHAEQGLTAEDQAIGGLIGLAAFGAISIGALLTVEAVVAAVEGGTLVEGVTTAAGNTYYGITLAAAEAQEAAFAGGVLTQEGATAIMTSAVMNGGSSLSAAGLIDLFNYEPDRWNFWNLGGGGITIYPGGPGGGYGGIPGFPDFPGGGHGWHRYCYVVEANGIVDVVCYYED